MMRAIQLTVACVAVFIATLGEAQGGVITPISLIDFVNPNVLDFESATLGAISGTDPLFTSFGIASISAAASSFSDTYNVRTNSSRALWFNAAGLVVVDPGAGSLSQATTYTINLDSIRNHFGVGVHDQGGTVDVEFFDGLTSVGTTAVSAVSADLNQFYWSNTDSFDRVTLRMGGGFAIDNITVETRAVPEPSSLAMFGIGACFLGAARRRRREKQQKTSA